MNDYNGSVGKPRQAEPVTLGEVKVVAAKIEIVSYEGHYLIDKVVNAFKNGGLDVLMQPLTTMNDRDCGVKLTIYSKR